MQEFKVGAHNYRADKLDAFQQWDVARRLLAAFMDAAKKGGGAAEVFMRAFASMSDADDRVVRHLCLAVVSREDRGGWQRLVTAEGHLVYNDLAWGDILAIVQNVVDKQVFPFTDAPAQGSSDERRGSVSSSSPPSEAGSSVR
jgi:hypothetical protein